MQILFTKQLNKSNEKGSYIMINGTKYDVFTNYEDFLKKDNQFTSDFNNLFADYYNSINLSSNINPDDIVKVFDNLYQKSTKDFVFVFNIVINNNPNLYVKWGDYQN